MDIDRAFKKTVDVFSKPKTKKEKSKYDLKSIENKLLRKIIKELLNDVSKLKEENKELFMKIDELQELIKK